MKITLVTVGTRGDVQPMVALGRVLRERGHVVKVAAPPDFEAWVTSEGLAFAPVGADIRQYLQDNPGALSARPMAAFRAGRHFFNTQLEPQVRDALAACEGADAIAWSGLAIGATIAAEKLKLPVLGIFYSTCVLPSGQHPPVSVPHYGAPPWLNRLLWVLNSLATQIVIGKPFNAIRARAGLPPIKFRSLVPDGDYVVAADPVLFPHDPAWGPNIRKANFIYYDDQRPIDAGLDAWINAGEPPVYVGFGSMSGDGTARMEKIVHDALTATGRRCLIGAGWAGWAGLGTHGLPAHWRVTADVPHEQLFPRMAAVVHHGGSGTTANALRAGVPQVIVPLILDQHHHAHQLWKAGLVPRTQAMEQITAVELARAIDTAMALPQAPRDIAAQRLRHSDGAGDVARALEALVASRV